ncbi:MAG: LysM peptidoglycan-binding domain-containing protein, partial [Bacteroidota bacterium]
MVNIRRLIKVFLLLLAIAGGDLYSQVPVNKSKNKVIIEGKIYYIHIVKPGQTLYSISRAYEVAEKTIAIENPGVYSGVQVGQVLKIPFDVPEVEAPDQDVDTSKYISHRLQQGETLYSLSKRYNIPVEEIGKANPDLNLNDIPVGMIILIPKLSTVYSEDDYILHKVRRKETIYRLSKRYNVAEETIIEFNPELKWSELKTGQVIRIPKEEYLASREVEEIVDAESIDTLNLEEERDVVEDYLLIDSLGLEQMSEDDYYDKLKDFNKRRLNIAFLIPFNYRISKPEQPEIEREKTEKEIQEEEAGAGLPRSINYLEFFEGSLIALDSLKKEGFDLNVQYFDTYRTPSKVRKILGSEFFREVDLIIGPFFAYN